MIIASTPVSRLAESLPHVMNFCGSGRHHGRCCTTRYRVTVGFEANVDPTGPTAFGNDLSVGRASIDFRHDCFIRQFGFILQKFVETAFKFNLVVIGIDHDENGVAIFLDVPSKLQGAFCQIRYFSIRT